MRHAPLDGSASGCGPVKKTVVVEGLSDTEIPTKGSNVDHTMVEPAILTPGPPAPLEPIKKAHKKRDIICREPIFFWEIKSSGRKKTAQSLNISFLSLLCIADTFSFFVHATEFAHSCDILPLGRRLGRRFSLREET